MAMVTIIGTAIMVIIHGPMVMAMDIQVGTIIMAIMTITTIIIAGIITMAIMVGTMASSLKMTKTTFIGMAIIIIG